MRFITTALALVIAALLSAAPASAQTTSGTIIGRVVDNQNLAVPGVTVSVEGPNLQGANTAVTSENGDYILPQLPPGTYTVSFTLSGFGRQQRTIAVAPTQTVPLNVTLGVAALDETVNVVGKSADVLTQTAQVATNFQQDLIAMLPTNRDITSALLMAPAVHPSGPGGNFSIAGAMSYESLYLVNGVTVNENLRGQAFNIYIEDAIQETTIASDGVSAEYGRFSGGLVNVITKSGSNQFAGSFRESLFNDNWRALVTGNGNYAAAAAGSTTQTCNTVTSLNGAQGVDPNCFANDTKVDKIVPTHEYVFGGPVRKDQLWFFTAGRFQNQQVARNTIQPVNLAYLSEDQRKRFEIKMTGSINCEPPARGCLRQGGADAGQQHLQHRELDGPCQPLYPRNAARSLHAELQRHPLAAVVRRGARVIASLQLHRQRIALHRPEQGHAADRPRPRRPLLVADLLRRLRSGETRQRQRKHQGDVLQVDQRLGIAPDGVRLRHLQRQAVRQQPPVGQRLPDHRHDLDHPRQRRGCGDLPAVAAGLVNRPAVQPDRDQQPGHRVPDPQPLLQRSVARSTRG